MQTLSCISFRQPWPFLAMCVAHSASTEPVTKIQKLYTSFTHWNNEMRQHLNSLNRNVVYVCVGFFWNMLIQNIVRFWKNAVHGLRKIVNWPLNVWLSLNGLRLVPWFKISITIHGKRTFFKQGRQFFSNHNRTFWSAFTEKVRQS